MNLCCKCKEWRGTYNDEYDKCHINKCGLVRYDNYCDHHVFINGINIVRFLEQFDYNPKEIKFIGTQKERD